MFDLIQETVFRTKQYFGNGHAIMNYSYEDDHREQADASLCRINEQRLIFTFVYCNS